MPKWAMILSGVVILGGLVIGYVGLEPGVTNEERIYRIISDMEQAANRRDFPALLQYIAQDYGDEAGQSREDLKRLALQAGRGVEFLQVGVRVRGLVVSGKRATMQADLTVLEGTRPKPGNYTVNVTFERRGRRWLIVKADGWQDAVHGDLGGE